MSYLNQKCYIKAAIIFDGIFIGNQIISLQIKVYEVNVEKIENTLRRFLFNDEESEDNSDSEDK